MLVALTCWTNECQVDAAVFMAPMFRMHCGTPAMLWHFPLPFPITHMLTSLSCLLGLGKSHAIGFLNEKPESKIRWALTTDDKRLERWRQLRMKYPSVISCCVTNRWVVEAIKLQTWFGACFLQVRFQAYAPCMLFALTTESSLLFQCARADTAVHTHHNNRPSHVWLQRALSGLPSDIRLVCK